MLKVVKFGGSSLASAEQFKKVGKIIREEESRRYVIPSAPGKRFSTDIKVTDMLYQCYETAVQGKNFDKQLDDIKKRYMEIIEGLGLSLSLDQEFDTIHKLFADKAGADYAASRGEYLNGIIMANYLGFVFIDAAKSHYKRFLDASLPFCHENTLIVSDNVLLKGATASDSLDIKGRFKTNIKRMRQYLDYIESHPRLDTVIISCGDGLALSRCIR